METTTSGAEAPVDVWTALGDATRRAILGRVLRRPGSVTDLARGLPVSRPAVSQHLHVLLRARLVDVRPRGRERIYVPCPDGLASARRDLEDFWTQALRTFKSVAEHSYPGTGER